MRADGQIFEAPGICIGAVDEMFVCVHGSLFYWPPWSERCYFHADRFQNGPVVAYQQEVEYTQITECKKFPAQNRGDTSFAKEYPLPYWERERLEPYYPVLTEESQA